MLNPSVDQLLAGMADALSRSVLSELPPGPARDELRAAIALTRRLARAVPRLTAYLQADTADLALSLGRLWPALGIDEPTGGPVADALALARSLPPDPLPTTTELTTTNLVLRQALADLVGGTITDPVDHSPVDGHDAGDVSDPVVDAEVRALLLRLARREAEQLGLSPWAPLPRDDTGGHGSRHGR